MRPTKHVTVGGLTWTVISANERAITHAGRHFFACRCRCARPWKIHEHDSDITRAGAARPLKVFTNGYHTATLSQAVKEICGEPPATRFCEHCSSTYEGELPDCPYCGADSTEPHPWVTFEEHWAAMQARRDASTGGKS